MVKEGDNAVMYCGKCKVETPHTYKISTMGDISRKLLNLRDIGSGWYCDNCSKKNTPQDLEDFDTDNIVEEDSEEY